MYPTSCRATGVGVCSAFTRLAGTITPIVGEILFKYSIWFPFFLYGCGFIIAGLVSSLLPYETSNSKLTDTIGQRQIPVEDVTIPRQEEYSRLSSDDDVQVLQVSKENQIKNPNTVFSSSLAESTNMSTTTLTTTTTSIQVE